MKIDASKLTPAVRIKGQDDSETFALCAMFDEASQFLLSFNWCGEIKESYFGMGVGGVLAVFLFRIVPKKTGVDEWLWVVTGDIPPAYLVTDEAPNPACALAGYVREMTRWVD